MNNSSGGNGEGGTKDYLLLNVEREDYSIGTIGSVNHDETKNGETEKLKNMATITHRRHDKEVSHHERALMSNFESLDFSEADNILLRKYNNEKKMYQKIFKTLGKWVICTLIGVFVGLACYCLKESVDKLQELKFSQVEKYYNKTIIIVPFLIYLGFNLLYGIMSCLLVILFGPLCGSSGLPEVKGYLNGVRISKAFNIKTLLGKLSSLIFSFSSGLVLGPEGPMFHIGSCIGSSISQFKSKTLKFHIKSMWVFQNDSDKRDFISCGSAAGIAAAFGAPIGGVLFTLEEGSSFWSRQLTWRTFFSCLIATLVANLFLQGFKSNVSDYGVISFGVSKSYLYSYPELIPFMCMGVIGGLLGSLFVALNLRLNHFRKRVLGTNKLYKLLEVIVIVILSSLICFFTPLLASCRPLSGISPLTPGTCDPSATLDLNTVEFNCQEGYYNPLASLTLTTLEDSLQILFSRNNNIFTPGVLIAYSIFYFSLTVITSGLYVASGIFIPMMLIGSALGRLTGLLLSRYFTSIDPSIYALIGAAAMMSGSLRMTISLVVIIVELTETTQYLLPVILVVMIAKWTGDIFNESIYEHLIELKHIPYLNSQPAYHQRKKTVAEAMSNNVLTLPEIVKVKTVIQLLESCTHNGFPVVMLPNLHSSTTNNNSNNNGLSKRSTINNSNNNIFISDDDDSAIDNNNPHNNNKNNNNQHNNILCGLILRSQLSILLKRKIFCSKDGLKNIDFISEKGYNLPIDHVDFSQELASKIQPIFELSKSITPQDNEKYIDLRPYMDFSVCSIKNYSSLNEAYKIFRLVGLRHMVVINVFNHVVGMLTRKDLL